LPPNYGEVYRKGFEKVFTDIIKQSNLEKLPFLLDGVAGERSLNQSDGIHPNIKGHELIAEKLYPIFKRLGHVKN